MPDKPTWMDRISDLIAELAKWPDQLLGTAEVAKLFEVKPRQAQVILKDAGASAAEGKASFIEPGGLIEWLRYKGGPGLGKQERDRRIRMAKKMVRFQAVHELQYKACPKGEYEVVPPLAPENEYEREMLRAAGVAGLRNLPREIELGRGKIIFHFGDNPEMLFRLLLQFALIAGKDMEALVSLIRPGGEFDFSEDRKEPQACPVCSGFGFICDITGAKYDECGCLDCERGPSTKVCCPECLGGLKLVGAALATGMAS